MSSLKKNNRYAQAGATKDEDSDHSIILSDSDRAPVPEKKKKKEKKKEKTHKKKKGARSFVDNETEVGRKRSEKAHAKKLKTKMVKNEDTFKQSIKDHEAAGDYEGAKIIALQLQDDSDEDRPASSDEDESELDVENEEDIEFKRKKLVDDNDKGRIHETRKDRKRRARDPAYKLSEREIARRESKLVADLSKMHYDGEMEALMNGFTSDMVKAVGVRADGEREKGISIGNRKLAETLSVTAADLCKSEFGCLDSTIRGDAEMLLRYAVNEVMPRGVVDRQSLECMEQDQLVDSLRTAVQRLKELGRLVTDMITNSESLNIRGKTMVNSLRPHATFIVRSLIGLYPKHQVPSSERETIDALGTSHYSTGKPESEECIDFATGLKIQTNLNAYIFEQYGDLDPLVTTSVSLATMCKIFFGLWLFEDACVRAVSLVLQDEELDDDQMSNPQECFDVAARNKELVHLFGNVINAARGANELYDLYKTAVNSGIYRKLQ